MGLINTQPFGLMRPHARVEARNAHLMPEIHQRMKRILQSAKEEEIMSVSTIKESSELWHRIKTGRPCSCGQDVQKQHECECMKQGVPDILEFLHGANNPAILNNAEFCPICLGQKIAGGYEIQGCTSIILTADLGNFSIEGNVSVECDRPWCFRLGTSGTITWEVQLPKYYIKCHTIVAHWRNRPPKYFSLDLNDKEFDLDTFNLIGQMENNKPVKISLYMEDTEGTVQLDYLRIILQMNRQDMVNVDFPNYTYSYTGELSVQNEVQSSITANFDGRQKIETTDIFVVEKDGIAWRVFEVEDNAPLQVTISQNAQARLVRSYENYYILPSKLMQKAYPMENYSFLY